MHVELRTRSQALTIYLISPELPLLAKLLNEVKDPAQPANILHDYFKMDPALDSAQKVKQYLRISGLGTTTIFALSKGEDLQEDAIKVLSRVQAEYIRNFKAMGGTLYCAMKAKVQG